MKNSFFKTLVVLLSAILLMGAIVGVTAFADEAPSVEIVRKNISYDGAVRVLYAIDVQNPGDNTIEVRFYEADPTGSDAELLYTNIPTTTVELGNKTYQVVFSDGFAPAELRKSVFALPVLVDGEGEVVAEGSVVEYSPYIYAMNRFDKDCSEDQFTLYKAFLDYGGAVQRAICDEATVAANGGYADAYYNITLSSALKDDVDNTVEIISGNFSALDLAGGAVVAPADIGDGTSFLGFADANGNITKPNDNDSSRIITTNDVTPGKNLFLALYEEEEVVGEEVGGVYYRSNAAGTRYDMSTLPTLNNNDPSNTPVFITDNGTLNFKSVGTKESGLCFQALGGSNIVVGAGSRLVVEFDLLFVNCENSGNNGSLFFGLPNVASPANWNAMNNTKSVYKWFTRSDGHMYAYNYTYDNSRITKGEWCNFRIEYQINEDGTGTYTGYVNNEVTFTTSITGPATKFAGFAILGNPTSITELEIDNMFIGVDCAEHNIGKFAVPSAHQGGGVFKESCSGCGMTTNDTFTLSAGNGKYFGDDNAIGSTVTFENMGDFNGYNAHGATGMSHGVAGGTYSLTATTYDVVVLEPSGNVATRINAGQKFVLEFDMRYTGELTGEHRMFFGPTNAAWNGGNSNIIYPSDSLFFNNNYAYFQYAPDDLIVKDVWYNVRYEYLVASNGASATYSIFLNDKLIFTTPDTAVDSSVFGLLLQSRENYETINLNFDNFYMGIEIPPYEPGTGKYFADGNATGTKCDMDTNSIGSAYDSNAGSSEMTHGASDGVYNLNVKGHDIVTLCPAGASGMTLTNGETLILEFDMKFNSNLTSDKVMYFGPSSAAWQGSNSTIIMGAGYSLTFKPNGAASFSLVSGCDLVKNRWFNIRYEYTISDDGSYAYWELYVNNELVYDSEDATPDFTVVGLLIQSKDDGAGIIDISFDNFYMGIH